MRHVDRRALAAAAIVLMAALAGCASQSAGNTSHSTAASPATSSPPIAVSAPAVTEPPGASPDPVAASPQASGACLTQASIRYPGSDNPLRAVCVRVGGTITVTLTVTGGYRWTVPVSSNPAVATVGTTYTATDGTLHATITARTPGTTTLSAGDAFAPPHGPPSRLWMLTVTVRP